jgi:hypothetical protein
MRCFCLLVLFAACTPKEVEEPDTSGNMEPDSDGDGYPLSEDCDDADASINPDAAELCDSIDNNCDGEIDNDPVDAGIWYTDGDDDGYGDPGTAVVLCEQPSGTVDNDGDCSDENALISPDAAEVCDKADTDEDCSGAADDADPGVDPGTQRTFYTDGDDDGYGDRDAPGALYCDPPAGVTEDATDCNDGDALINPDAVEECDGIDNDCDGDADSGTLGSEPLCSATTCLAISDDGGATDGLYWLDPDGDGAESAEIYCDLTSDGGGWSLLSWTGDSTNLSGVPYPGLSICEKPPCSRGSSADDVLLTDLIAQSTQIGIGHSPKALSSYQNLTDYDYSGYYDYGSMKGFSLDTYSGTTVGCDLTGFASGTFYSLSGPTDYDGTTLYVAQSFRYYEVASSYNDFSESSSYIWNIGAYSYCGGTGSAPGAWMGTWSTREYGPYSPSSAGARAVWVR